MRFDELQAKGDNEGLLDLLTQPLHEALYLHGSFELYDEMSNMQQMLVAFDYLRTQAGQGGFIQFLHNGYVSLLPELIGGFTRMGRVEMAGLLDDVLKVYVLNKDVFDQAQTVDEFARLYDELKEFESLDADYLAELESVKVALVDFSVKNVEEIAIIK